MWAGQGIVIEVRKSYPFPHMPGFEEWTVGYLALVDVEMVATMGQGVGEGTGVLERAPR